MLLSLLLSLDILVSSHVWFDSISMKRLIYELNLQYCYYILFACFLKLKTFTLPILVR